MGNIDRLAKPTTEPIEKQWAILPEDTKLFAGQFFYRHAGEKMTPDGFVTAARLLIYDMEVGTDSKTREPFRGKVVGLTSQPPLFYSLLQRSIPLIAETFCPSDFAQGVKTFLQEAEKRNNELLRGGE